VPSPFVPPSAKKVLGTCQACFRRFAIRPTRRWPSGVEVATHGFRRSGDLEGCPGAGQPPYEISVELTKLSRSHLAHVELVGLEARKRELETADEIDLVVAAIARPAPEGRRAVVFRRGRTVDDPDAARFARTFEEAQRNLVASVAFEIRELKQLIADLDDRIARWRPAPEKLGLAP